MSKDSGESSPQKKSYSWKRSKLEVKAEKILKSHGLDWFEEEHRFCKRRWRFDIAFVEEKIAIAAKNITKQPLQGGKSFESLAHRLITEICSDG